MVLRVIAVGFTKAYTLVRFAVAAVGDMALVAAGRIADRNIAPADVGLGDDRGLSAFAAAGHFGHGENAEAVPDFEGQIADLGGQGQTAAYRVDGLGVDRGLSVFAVEAPCPGPS